MMNKNNIPDLSVLVEFAAPKNNYLGENNWRQSLFSSRL